MPVSPTSPVLASPVIAAHVEHILRTAPLPLFALLDAARDERILELVRASGEEHESLYEGVTAGVLSEYAPYLVRLPAAAPLIGQLASEGWGRSWGIYLTSGARMPDVRRHFRKLLYVRTEADKTLYFRFYDPRVLRAFLPTCAPRQIAMLWGEVDTYLVEAKQGDAMLAFRASDQTVSESKIPLGGSVGRASEGQRI